MEETKMNFAIYEMAMYEIVKKIHAVSPSYHLVMGEDYDKCKHLMEDVFEFTDELTNNFPSIDDNTYAMIVCGAIMEAFVCNIEFSINMFDDLQAKFADESTKKYFKHIYCAIDSIMYLYSYDTTGEIIEWPDELRFDYTDYEDNIDDFNNELLAAIEECPNYSYAYCLVIVPYINSLQGVSFDFAGADARLREAFINSHKYMGDELFSFVLSGDLTRKPLSYALLDAEDGDEELPFYDDETAKDLTKSKKVIFTSEIADYVNKKKYSYEDIRGAEIIKGYFNIQQSRIPAGIPFYKLFYTDEYNDFLKEMFSYIPQECDGAYSPKWGDNILTDQGDFRIEYKNFALYGGVRHMMPLYDRMPKSKEIEEFLRTTSLNHAISSLLDVSAEEMKQLKKVNKELKKSNEDLSRHIKLNQELVRSLSHSSANYLNSDKLAKTGIQLHGADYNNPTIDALHIEGLGLILQSEQEMYLSRQLNGLVWRCTADIESLNQQIRGGLSTEGGVDIFSPIEFALKIVMARILFREDDKRAEFIRMKLTSSESEITNLQSSFMLDVLATKDEYGVVLKWWNENICEIRVSISDVWKKLQIIKNKSFYDLIIEILTEQLLNALSHGNIKNGFDLSFGQAEEFKGRPRWTYIECRNECGNAYTGGRGVGLSTLNETALLLNGNKKGIETVTSEGLFICKTWVLASLLRVL